MPSRLARRAAAVALALGIALSGWVVISTAQPYRPAVAPVAAVVPACSLPAAPAGARPAFNHDVRELVAWWTPGAPVPVPRDGVAPALVPPVPPVSVDPSTVDPERSLFITDAAPLARQPTGSCEPGAAGLGRWTLGCVLVRVAGSSGGASALARPW